VSKWLVHGVAWNSGIRSVSLAQLDRKLRTPHPEGPVQLDSADIHSGWSVDRTIRRKVSSPDRHPDGAREEHPYRHENEGSGERM
jgi:hypothetical protein